MNLKKWLTVILIMGLFLAFNPLSGQAGPYHHPYGKAYGWHGKRHHGFDRGRKHSRHCYRGPHDSHHFAGPPPVAYVTPVTPLIGIPYAQPQYSQPATPGFSGSLNYNF